MGVLPFAVVLSTVALTSAIARIPGGTPRQQQVFEYFPDFRYPDEMVNPEFMTAECMSEGVFQHPYKCTWFYRCHDRIGRGFFHTSYFICEPGTEFDDDLDQCIPKSGTCGDEDELYCDTLLSSCRNCNGQNLCEFQECYWGGRDAGIQRICEPGQLHNGQTCVEASCPAPNSPTGECPLNKLRPTAKWTDEASGCSEYPGCRNGKNYHETLCSSYYDCPWGTTKVQRSCPEGYLFSPQWELCIQPPKVDADCVPTNSCHPSQGEGDTCQQYSGCLEGATYEITQTLCEYYSCPEVVRKRCPGADQVFNPDTRRCQKMLSTCPPTPACSPENAKIWEQCTLISGCRGQSLQRVSELLCQEYSCSDRNNLRPCGPGQLFDSQSRTCVLGLIPCPPPRPITECTPGNAYFWGGCFNETGCAENGQELTVQECQNFKCSSNGNELSCQNGQVFSPASRTCVNPITFVNCPCTVDRAEFWGDCVDVTGCSADNPIKQYVKQCQHYQCSVFGTEFRCDFGQVFNSDSKTCMDPLSTEYCPCTADQAEFWGDCVDITGCTADNQIQRTEKQCQYFSCSNGGTEFRCEGRQVFSPEQRSCVEPLNDALCPCTIDRANYGSDCLTTTGCNPGSLIETTVEQCQYFQCNVGGQKVSCENGLVYDNDRGECVNPLGECPINGKCTPEYAQKWTACRHHCGNDGRKVEQCYAYSCSLSLSEKHLCNDELPIAQQTELFDPVLKRCTPKLSACPRSSSPPVKTGTRGVSCKPTRANWWYNCSIRNSCVANRQPQQQQKLCEKYSCEDNGPELLCIDGQMFDIEKAACVTPLKEFQC